MCTAIRYKNYFGRNLDFEFSYGEDIIISPRNFEFKFLNEKSSKNHYAIIGIGTKKKDYPLYFDAMNETGLCVAGLLFPENANYNAFENRKSNIAPFEFIPWILSDCDSVADAKVKLYKTNIIDVDFSQNLKNTPLHWMISDKESSIVAEPTKKGLKIYDNPLDVLTNSPEFPFMAFNLNNYLSLSNENKENTFSKRLNLNSYSRGMGTLGLPGDLSSISRFVRASFFIENSFSGFEGAISHFFHILSSVEQPKGANKVGGDYEFTIYSSCADMIEKVFYYKTYSNSRIRGVDLKKEDLNHKNLITYSSHDIEDILLLNVEKNL